MVKNTKFIHLTVCKTSGFSKEIEKINIVIRTKIIKYVVEVDKIVDGGGSWIYTTEPVANFGTTFRVVQAPQTVQLFLERVLDKRI